jgi:Domain of unknown function (DUF3291)
MPNPNYHLAQLNIARLVAPIDSPILADFVAQLEEINQLGDHSPGFVWRLMKSAYFVLWWVPAGHIPTVAEAKERLEMLQTQGDTAAAFSIKHTFAAPEPSTVVQR